MAIKFKKYISILLIVFLTLTSFLPAVSFAQETTTDSTSSPQAETTVDNTATVDNTSDTTSNTGDNSINPTPTPSVSASNSATVTNDVTSTGNTGENQIIATGSAVVDANNNDANNNASLTSDQNTSTATINTGDSISVSTAENNINSISINSKIIYQTINIFADQNGNIDLSTPANVVNSIINNDKNTDPVINVTIINNENYAYLANNIVSFADTGNNSISGADNAYVNTGNAYSAVSLLNKLNLTVVNSELHLITINVFGKLFGNIVLPDQVVSQPTCSNCSYQEVAIGNTANVENNVSSSAITGQNKIEAIGLTAVETGNALAMSNILNLVNTNYIGINITNLQIANYGNWQGAFLGWGDLLALATSNGIEINSLSPNTGCVACGDGKVTITNYAEVLNNITSSANTGGNNIASNNGFIRTGNAISQISLFNLINSNIINSNAYFTFINIFGDWTGNIGGEKEFIVSDTTDSDNTNGTDSSNSQGVEQKSDSDNKEVREDGGLLEVTQSNNVGSYVLPGDTVTFFIKVKNLGKGKLYETKLRLVLIKDGKEAGGTVFNLGVIEPGKSFKITTGLVLSKLAPGGEYVARATAAGLTGQDNKKLFAIADSDFKIFSGGFAGLGSEEKPQKIDKMVLGTVAKPENRTKAKNDQVQKLYLLLILTAYTGIKVIRKRKIIGELFNSRLPVKVRLYTLRSILL